MDDFFADLLPSKSADKPKSDSNSNSPFNDDAVLPSKLDSPKSTMSQSSLDLMATDSHKASANSAQIPMGEPKMRKELKEYQQVMQSVVEGAIKHFSTDLTRVLSEISRRLESLESQTQQLVQAGPEADSNADETLKERLTGIEKSLHDLGRNVQLVRDRQELAGAQAELAAHLSAKGTPEVEATQSASSQQASSTPQPTPPVQTAPTPAAAPAQVAAQAPAQAAAAPAPPAHVMVPAPSAAASLPPTPSAETPTTPKPSAPSAPAAAHMPQPAPAQGYGQTPFQPAPQMPQEAPQQQQQPPQQQQQQLQLPPYCGSTPPQPQASPAPQAPQWAPPPAPPSSSYAPPPPPVPGAPQAGPYGGQHDNSKPPAYQSLQGPPAPPPAPPQQPERQQSGYAAPSFPPVPGAPSASYLPSSMSLPTPSGPPQGQGYYSQGPPSGPPPPPPPAAPPRQQFAPAPPPSMPQYSTPGQFGPSQGAYPAPPAPAQSMPGYHSTGQQRYSRGPAPPPPNASQGSNQTRTQSVPLEKVIDDIVNMGFSRHEVRGVVHKLMESGQSIDLNIVLDRLMNGMR